MDHKLIISDEQADKRLDQVLSESYPCYSRNKLQDWLKAGFITFNGLTGCKGKVRVKPGQIISVNQEAIDKTNFDKSVYQPENIPLNIVYQDDDIILINKPSNLVVHPGAGNWNGTLVNGLLYHFPELQSLPRAGVVHRLDKDTTGLMVVARNDIAHASLVKQLQARQVNRTYNALVYGHMITSGTVNAAIGRHPTNRLKMAVLPDDSNRAKPAVTHYKILKKYPKHTLLELKLETGRTHQIRVHMAHIGYTIVGDSLYGRLYATPNFAAEEDCALWQSFRRQALSAVELGFMHPRTDEYVQWRVDLPPDMQNLIDLLNKTL